MIINHSIKTVSSTPMEKVDLNTVHFIVSLFHMFQYSNEIHTGQQLSQFIGPFLLQLLHKTKTSEDTDQSDSLVVGHIEESWRYSLHG